MSQRNIIFSSLPKNSIGLEIGVWYGEFSNDLCEQLSPVKMYGIDPYLFVDTKPDSWYGGFWAKSQADMDYIFKKTQTLLSKYNFYTLIKDSSNNITNYIEENTLDWVYVDGDHDYNPVLVDLINSHKLIKEGGIISGDDCPEIATDPIYRAVQKFLSLINYKKVVFHNRQYIIYT